ncbi:MAG: DNA-binding protein [Betaproteobacteria bacterium]|nr:DNA-binding protein [Betaproteobacteria bacterium]
MPHKVYIETSFISYLTAPPSRDVVALGRQEVTRHWWETQRQKYSLLISPVVLEEARQGHPEYSQARLKILTNIPVTDISPMARLIASAILKEKALPQNAAVDALHIAIAGASRVQFLLTWNFRHIANVRMRSKIEAILKRFDIEPPLLCTPDQLSGDDS